jgi:hypothetical protein
MQTTISVNPQNPQPGQQVTFTITATDPDASQISLDNARFGDEGPSISPGSAAQPSGYFLWEIRGQTTSNGRQAYGPWDPPAAVSGTKTFTVTHTYSAAGTYQADFNMSSACPQTPPGVGDPYANTAYQTVTVTVGQAR